MFVLNELMNFPFIPKTTFSKPEDGFLPRYFTQWIVSQADVDFHKDVYGDSFKSELPSYSVTAKFFVSSFILH